MTEYLGWGAFEVFVDLLVNKVKGNKYDSIMCVSTGGLLLGKMLSDKLSLPLSVISAKSYDRGNLENGKLEIGNISSVFKIEGKILLVDDLVDSGNTMKKIVEHLSLIKSITKIETAVIYKKTKSTFIPDFYIKETNDWIVFFYEKAEFDGTFKT